MRDAWTFARSATIRLTLRIPCLLRGEDQHAWENIDADSEERR